MSKETRKRLLLVAFTLLLTIPLAILLSQNLRGFVRDLVVMPLLYILWIGRLLLQSIPQSFLWIIFLIFAILTTMRSLIGHQGRAQTRHDLEKGRQGRVKELARRIELAEQSDYFHYQIARRLDTLVVETVSNSKRRTPEQVEQALDELDAPLEVKAYLQTQPHHTLAPSSNRTSPFARLVQFVQANVKPSSKTDLERVVQFLEDRLGVQQ
ncbi:MAG: hypothetical protein R6V13_02595 [Anaerolineae bacterium]